MDAGTITFYKNNTSQGQAFSGITGTAVPCFIGCQSAALSANFGQRPFSYTPPTGFKALNTFNLPDPTIKKPNQYMDVLTWTGASTSSGRTFTGLNFQPDFVWSKVRSTTYQHQLYDSARGTGKLLQSNTTNPEQSNFTYGYLSAFNSDGFTTVAGATDNVNWNETGQTYVAWNWKESATAGFDIVTYTGDGTNRNISHNLGVAPSMIIVKSRNATNGWYVCHVGSWGGDGNGLFLNNTAATYNRVTDLGGTGITAMTSSYFTATTGSGTFLNTSGNTYVAYLFAEIPGFSKFGSYTGNGSADGPFVYCGFRPRYLMIKVTNAVNEWLIIDSARDSYNVAGKWLSASSSVAEGANASQFDFTANGFKLRAGNSGWNGSGETLIFAAFAENPFKYSNAR
jgi:hypothetical protein